MARENEIPRDATFLDMQAAVGLTKHAGGYAATDELLARCQIDQAHTVLNVGCGIGVGSVYVARRYGCYVTGVDRSEKMIAWSRQRAREDGVTADTDFLAGDVLALPFASNHFDVVFCESVLNFVPDTAQAIAELLRVTRPGGAVGINEMFWSEEPIQEIAPQVAAMLGTSQPLPTAAVWQSRWQDSGLQDRQVLLRPIDAGQEVKDRIAWIGWRWMARAWVRTLRLVVTDPAIRHAIKAQFDFPPEVMNKLGYGLFTGRKPHARDRTVQPPTNV